MMERTPECRPIPFRSTDGNLARPLGSGRVCEVLTGGGNANRPGFATLALSGVLAAPISGQMPHDNWPFPHQAAQPADDLIADRLTTLKEIAADEDVPYSEDSEAGLRRAMEELNPVVRPSIFLLDNGNLRAVWKNLTGEQIGLQLIGENSVQLVLFVLREDGSISRIIGRDTITGAATQVRSLGLLSLLRG